MQQQQILYCRVWIRAWGYVWLKVNRHHRGLTAHLQPKNTCPELSLAFKLTHTNILKSSKYSWNFHRIRKWIQVNLMNVVSLCLHFNIYLTCPLPTVQDFSWAIKMYVPIFIFFKKISSSSNWFKARLSPQYFRGHISFNPELLSVGLGRWPF